MRVVRRATKLHLIEQETRTFLPVKPIQQFISHVLGLFCAIVATPFLVDGKLQCRPLAQDQVKAFFKV